MLSCTGSWTRRAAASAGGSPGQCALPGGGCQCWRGCRCKRPDRSRCCSWQPCGAPRMCTVPENVVPHIRDTTDCVAQASASEMQDSYTFLAWIAGCQLSSGCQTEDVAVLTLQAAMRSQGVTVESARLLSVDLTTPAARVQLPSGAVNAAAIAGGVTAAALVIAAAIGLGVWWARKRQGTPAPAEAPQEPEYRAEPFYCG